MDVATEEIKKLGNNQETADFLNNPFNVIQYLGADPNLGANLIEALQRGDPGAYDQYQDVIEKAEGHATGWGLSDPDHPQLCEEPFTQNQMTITFDDIAGAHLAKKELMIGFVYPATFPHLFTKTSSGVLLYGPPGTGKTLLAKAAVRELDNVAFYAPSPADLKGKYIGETEKNIRRVFVCALKDRPAIYDRSIIFMDEIESIGGVRGDSEGMNASVTALLQAMDGMSSDDTVSVLAATNYPAKLDSAVLRRFSSQIFVDLPTFEARLYLIVRAMSKAFNSLNKRKMSKLNLKLISPEMTWKGDKYGKGPRPRQESARAENWFWTCNCDFMQQLVEWGTIDTYAAQLRRLKDCKFVKELNKRITKIDIIDLTLMTGPKDDTETKKLMDTRTEQYEFSNSARTIYGFSGSDMDKLMDTIVRNASTRALYKKVAYTEIDETHTLIAIPEERISNMEEQDISVSNVPAYELERTARKLVESFDLTLYDFCVGLGHFRPTIDYTEYKNIVEYSKGQN